MSTSALYADAPAETIEVAGTSFAYRRLGPDTGVPVVFLHHLGAVLDNWDPRVIDGIAAHHRFLERDLTTYLEAQTRAGVTPEVVATCVARASLTTRPKARYVTPTRGGLVLRVLTTLPTRLTDAIKLRLVGTTA